MAEQLFDSKPNAPLGGALRASVSTPMPWRRAMGLATLLAAVLLPAASVFAQDTAAAGATAVAAAAAATAEAVPTVEVPALDSGNTAWLLISATLVLLMTLPGLALFYGGMVRKQNVLSMLMNNFTIACVATILWFLVGYSLAFTNGSAWIGGTDRLLLAGIAGDLASGSSHHFSQGFVLGQGVDGAFGMNVPELVFVMFQMTFAILTPALITGAYADRMKFPAMLIFTLLWMLLVYVPVAHWVWHPQGWLFAKGVLDFAGGTVVHINAGIAGLVAAIMLGKRKGYPAEPFPPHNLVLTVIGGALLWVGWFGFNAGSAIEADGQAGMAMANTQIATAAAALTWMFLEWALRGKPSVLGIVSGAVAGLVAVTPAAGLVAPSGAAIIGVAGGAAGYLGAIVLKRKLGYDDSLDVFGIHGMAGIAGAILTGVFAVKAVGGASGALDPAGANPDQVVTQLIGVVVTIAYTGVVTAIILALLKATIGLRVSEEVEREGLDRPIHGETVP